MALKMFHSTELVGLIKDIASEDLSVMSGTVELTPASKNYTELFEFFSDEDKSLYVEPPFPSHMLEDWTIEDESGQRRPITVPTVYEDGEICWRYY